MIRPFACSNVTPSKGQFVIYHLGVGVGGFWLWHDEMPEPSKILAPTPGLLPNHTLNLAKIC